MQRLPLSDPAKLDPRIKVTCNLIYQVDEAAPERGSGLYGRSGVWRKLWYESEERREEGSI